MGDIHSILHWNVYIKFCCRSWLWLSGHCNSGISLMTCDLLREDQCNYVCRRCGRRIALPADVVQPVYIQCLKFDRSNDVMSSPRRSSVSTIGVAMKAIFFRELGESSPCSSCSQMVYNLNNMTAEQVQARRSEIIAEIASRAATSAPVWWQRLAVVVDRAIHLGETERRIGVWLDEACDL